MLNPLKANRQNCKSVKVRISSVNLSLSLPPNIRDLMLKINNKIVWFNVLNTKLSSMITNQMTFRYTLNHCILKWQQTEDFYRVWNLFEYEVIG